MLGCGTRSLRFRPALTVTEQELARGSRGTGPGAHRPGTVNRCRSPGSCAPPSPGVSPPCTGARCPRTRRSWRSPARSTPRWWAATATARSGWAASNGSARSGTAPSGSARPASSRRRLACSPRSACIPSASTTCVTPAPARYPSSRRRFAAVEATELARNPFRVFTSMLVVDDPRYFDDDTPEQLRAFLDERVLFAPELLALADRAAAERRPAAGRRGRARCAGRRPRSHSRRSRSTGRGTTTWTPSRRWPPTSAGCPRPPQPPHAARARHRRAARRGCGRGASR